MEKEIIKKALEEISRKLVMKKEEIVEFLKEESENYEYLYKVVTQTLSIQGFIHYVNEIGAYAITNKGIKEVSK